ALRAAAGRAAAARRRRLHARAGVRRVRALRRPRPPARRRARDDQPGLRPQGWLLPPRGYVRDAGAVREADGELGVLGSGVLGPGAAVPPAQPRLTRGVGVPPRGMGPGGRL